MASQHEFDFSDPYDIMAGMWTGLTIIYDRTGEYLSSAASNVAIYWDEPHKLMHFRQGEEETIPPLFSANVEALGASALRRKEQSALTSDLLSRVDRFKDKAYLDQVAAVTTTEFDLHISGKYATASSPMMDVTGVNSRPDVYLFHLRLKDGSQSWFNNQYFTNANERQIVGPQLDKDGQIQLVVAQTFSRVSYDVPKTKKRSLKT
jgi:hypothetical protein